MNGHLVSVFIDNDPSYFRASGKIGLEVESTGGYYTRNIWLKRLNSAVDWIEKVGGGSTTRNALAALPPRGVEAY
jgi:hypothetical protein